MKCTDADVAEIDAYIASPKFLSAQPPSWRQSFGTEFSARWGVIDDQGAQVAELCFRVGASLQWPSITLLHRRRLVHRTDLVPATAAKPNPLAAHALGLPASVTGSHMHRWKDNREHVRLAGFGEMPIRWPIPMALRTFEQALAATADELNIFLEPPQRGFELPDQGDLF